MYHRAVAFKREAVIEQIGIAASVIKQNHRRRIEAPKVAHQIDDTLLALVHEAGKDVAELAHDFGYPGTGCITIENASAVMPTSAKTGRGWSVAIMPILYGARQKPPVVS